MYSVLLISRISALYKLLSLSVQCGLHGLYCISYTLCLKRCRRFETNAATGAILIDDDDNNSRFFLRNCL